MEHLWSWCHSPHSLHGELGQSDMPRAGRSLNAATRVAPCRKHCIHLCRSQDRQTYSPGESQSQCPDDASIRQTHKTIHTMAASNPMPTEINPCLSWWSVLSSFNPWWRISIMFRTGLPIHLSEECSKASRSTNPFPDRLIKKAWKQTGPSRWFHGHGAQLSSPSLTSEIPYGEIIVTLG